MSNDDVRLTIRRPRELHEAAKAKAAARTMRNAGRIPSTGAEVRARFERMRAEVEHGEEG